MMALQGYVTFKYITSDSIKILQGALEIGWEEIKKRKIKQEEKNHSRAI